MTRSTLSVLSGQPRPRPPASARAVFRVLDRLATGTLELHLPDGATARFGNGSGPRASITVHAWRACGRTLKSGDIGFAESYLDGEWSTADLSGLMQLLVANRNAVETAIYGSRWGRAAYRLRHLLNRNSKSRARKNVQAHYDLGNAFYRLWLDDTMSYSGAWFEAGADQPLQQAQWAKMRRALRECRLTPGQRLLDIGCGWGALAELAGREFGAQVVGVTLSAEQLRYARERLGADAPAQLRLQDWREIDDGPFDAICSVEMFEAVGLEYWGEFFATLRRLLKPGGRACLQTITIRDDLFDRYRRSTDFIQQYIFPGGLLPCPQAFRREARKAGFVVVNELDFGLDYARTLQCWRDRFHAAEPEVRRLGFDTRFMRIWNFYLAYCEAAFVHRNTSVMQFTLQRAS
ncbi:SAM-dependent methyltransferase [Caldimonas brevitalea]|uniref:Cyclopropane-fatty-acyl-phospholipid synthase n=1 Tax=Caldimonas brevitalea TaxID=413882 RepID=A0A0G3BGA3_9BURK|nr:cyclopropane-fatty-acyl-phospholipid synthase family protein [Caldimonas brevitalea]AKJ26998.1 cyclopropane-fatty-acyl-phospholipid synthase [Caldimonas brevitalea]